MSSASYRRPWLNGVAERFVATVRRELLAHVIVLNERHLRSLLESFIVHYHRDRTHLALGKDIPLRLGVNPILLGSGHPLFHTGPERMRLRVLEAWPLQAGCVILRYAPG